MRRLSLPVLLVILVHPAAMAAIYGWVDREGHTHYSDVPPPDVSAQALPIRESSVSTSAAPGIRPGEREWLNEVRARELERRRNREARDPGIGRRDDACLKLRTRIGNVEDELRGGYTARRGTELTQRLRDLRARHNEQCG